LQQPTVLKYIVWANEDFFSTPLYFIPPNAFDNFRVNYYYQQYNNNIHPHWTAFIIRAVFDQVAKSQTNAKAQAVLLNNQHPLDQLLRQQCHALNHQQ
jgi:hypothetical protein